ncbi:MAG TPA: hypothetical protein VEI25_01505 [Paraburkholderia sp.]|nr:hypothetical protein [Paraburkholderia sp.]
MNDAHTDGQLAAYERALDAQICAYNTAFADLGLRFRWDTQTLNALASIEDERARIIAYIESHHTHLLNAYSAEFLSEAILARKVAHTPDMLPAPPGVAANAPAAPRVHRSFERKTYPADEGGLPALAGA